MSGTESAKREAVKAAYPGNAWQQKVQKMSDNQIVAVYFRLKAQGKVN